MVNQLFSALGILSLVIANGTVPPSGITQEPQQQIVTQKTTQLDTLLASISSAPPEVAADVSLRIANSKLIDNKQKKIELLESYFGM